MRAATAAGGAVEWHFDKDEAALAGALEVWRHPRYAAAGWAVRSSLLRAGLSSRPPPLTSHHTSPLLFSPLLCSPAQNPARGQPGDRHVPRRRRRPDGGSGQHADRRRRRGHGAGAGVHQLPGGREAPGLLRPVAARRAGWGGVGGARSCRQSRACLVGPPNAEGGSLASYSVGIVISPFSSRQAGGAAAGGAVRRSSRVTFMVNIWTGERPADLCPLPDELAARMQPSAGLTVRRQRCRNARCYTAVVELCHAHDIPAHMCRSIGFEGCLASMMCLRGAESCGGGGGGVCCGAGRARVPGGRRWPRALRAGRRAWLAAAGGGGQGGGRGRRQHVGGSAVPLSAAGSAMRRAAWRRLKHSTQLLRNKCQFFSLFTLSE